MRRVPSSKEDQESATRFPCPHSTSKHKSRISSENAALQETAEQLQDAGQWVEGEGEEFYSYVDEGGSDGEENEEDADEDMGAIDE